MEADNEGFFYPTVNNNVCVNCGLCDLVCPILTNPERTRREISTYAAQNYNTILREQSSSGGIFTLLAERTLQNGGVVYGAAFDESCYSVGHIAITNVEELYKLRLSKYLQSDKKNIFADTEKELKAGKQVLFSGTPCEIAGLKCYLGKEYGNLLCIDLACHGVPSQKIWESHLKSFEKKFGGKVNEVNFRDKTHNIRHHRIIQTAEGKEIIFSKATDPYMLLFLRNYSLRPACYHCSFKGDNYYSDITLGDFWGIESVYPEMQDGLGTSLVITRTEQGLNALYEIESQIHLKKTEFSIAARNNTALVDSVKEPQDRNDFFCLFQSGNIDGVQKYALPSKKGIVEKIAETKVGKLLLCIKHGRILKPSEADFCVRYTINQ